MGAGVSMDLAGCSKVSGAWKFSIFEFEVAPGGSKGWFIESTRNDQCEKERF